MLAKGCWSETQTFGTNWNVKLIEADGSKFDLIHEGKLVGSVEWELIGQHNVSNAVMAIAASHHAGVQIADAIQALSRFKNVKRRMETKGKVKGVTVYDDFAHHPTAIQTTLDGLRKKVGNARIIAILEPRSNTMKMGIHKDTLANSWQQADEIHLFEPENLGWSLSDMVTNSKVDVHLYQNTQQIVDAVSAKAKPGDHILIMSNGGFNGIHGDMLEALGS